VFDHYFDDADGSRASIRAISDRPNGPPDPFLRRLES
jgi:hypothetical protein